MNDENHQLTGWQLDKSAPEAYERYLVPAIFESWTARVLDHAQIQDGDKVLDLACGTGIVARHSVSQVGTTGSVVGLDINDGMLGVAEQTVNHPGIEWRRGDALDLPFAEGSFDVVCCQQALQFFDDPVVALEEVRSVLSPGGRAVFSVWRPITYQPGYRILADAMERLVGEDVGTMMRSPFPDWDVADLHEIAESAGCSTIGVTIEIGSMRYPSTSEFVQGEAASSPLAEEIGAIDAETRNGLLRAVSSGLDGYRDDEGIITPMESYVLRWDE